MKETYGVPFEEIKEGIRNGVRKVNIDTDIRLAMTGAMRRTMVQEPSVFDPRIFLKAAREATKDLCQERYVEFGSAGWASKIKPVSLDTMARGYGY
jgi:fructose-bisphosphate aldolase class II